MTGWRKVAGRVACRVWQGVRRTRPGRPGFRVLMYHAVGTSVPGDRRGLYDLAPANFRDHADLLAARTDVMDVRRARTEPTGVAISFDDGYLDTLRTAAPMLVARGLPFTVFVTAGFVRLGHPLYLAARDLRELASLPGATIGAHGDTHVRMTTCSADRLRHELVDSRHFLEDLVQRPVVTMSYPHGAVDERVKAAVLAAGYELAASSDFGANTTDRDSWQLKRTEIWRGDSRSDLADKLGGAWDWMA